MTDELVLTNARIVTAEAVVDGTWSDPQLEVVIDRKLTGATPALPRA